MSCRCNPAPVNDFECTAIQSCMLADGIAWLTVKCPELASEVRPGQCVMIFPARGLDPLLARPFAVADANAARGEISVCYAAFGKGTKMMTSIEPGDVVRVRGLFGMPFTFRPGKKVYLTGGGAGAAIFLMAAANAGEIAGLYVGVPGRGYEKLSRLFSSISSNVHIFADDGSFGEGDSMFKSLPAELGVNEEIWACGPPGFIGAMKKFCARTPDRLYLSLDRHMACGYGGCMGCVVQTKDGPKRLCVDQSLFRADEVVEDEK